MPFFFIHGLPDSFGAKTSDLENLRDKITDAAFKIEELQLSAYAAPTVYFPMDMLDSSEDRRIFAKIVLFDKPERAPAVLNRLSESVGKVLQSEFPSRKVRCACIKINQDDGWWSS